MDAERNQLEGITISLVCAGVILKEPTCRLRHITTEKWALLIRGMHYSKHYVKKVASTEWL